MDEEGGFLGGGVSSRVDFLRCGFFRVGFSPR